VNGTRGLTTILRDRAIGHTANNVANGDSECRYRSGNRKSDALAPLVIVLSKLGALRSKLGAAELEEMCEPSPMVLVVLDSEAVAGICDDAMRWRAAVELKAAIHVIGKLLLVVVACSRQKSKRRVFPQSGTRQMVNLRSEEDDAIQKCFGVAFSKHRLHCIVEHVGRPIVRAPFDKNDVATILCRVRAEERLAIRELSDKLKRVPSSKDLSYCDAWVMSVMSVVVTWFAIVKISIQIIQVLVRVSDVS